jgi:NAD(P)-dependent dehydrogenase (short-subunit alcohol dehydrogenase family)
VSRVAVVTGGASGIGLGVAKRFATDGHLVAIFDRNAVGRKGGGRGDHATGGTAIAADVDVADWASVDAGFARVSRRARSGRDPGDERRGRVVRSAGRHHAGDLEPHHLGQSDRHVHVCAERRARHGRRRLGPNRHDLVVERAVREHRA